MSQSSQSGSQSRNHKKTGRRYSHEFKAAAVKLVTQQGLSQAEVGRRLGVSSGTLCGWVQQLAPGGHLTDQQMQTKIKQLEQENRRLKMEREILKKAATFFASESR